MRLQYQGQEFVRDGRNGRQAHVPRVAGAQVVRGAAQCVELAVDAAGLGCQHLGLGRGREAGRRAHEQAVAQLQLGVRHGLAHGRGGDAQQARCRAHVAGLQHGLEHLELAQVHGYE